MSVCRPVLEQEPGSALVSVPVLMPVPELELTPVLEAHPPTLDPMCALTCHGRRSLLAVNASGAAR